MHTQSQKTDTFLILAFGILASGPPSTAAPCSPFGFEEVFKEGKGIQGGKRHSTREKAIKEGNIQIFQKFSKNLFLKFKIFLVIPRSWGVYG